MRDGRKNGTTDLTESWETGNCPHPGSAGDEMPVNTPRPTTYERLGNNRRGGFGSKQSCGRALRKLYGTD